MNVIVVDIIVADIIVIVQEEKDFSGGEGTNEPSSFLFFKKESPVRVRTCMHVEYNGDVRVGPVDVRTGNTAAGRFRGDEPARDRLKREERATERSFSFGGKKKTGARFALHSWPSLWGEKRLLLRNVISMSLHNEPDNTVV